MPIALTYQGVVLAVLRRHYGGRGAAKKLARDAGTSHRTAANWLDGLNSPAGENLINLMARCDELAAEIDRLVRHIRGKQQ